MSHHKILMITSLYPVDNQVILHNTNVCHYFAKEWVKMGYDVRIIFNYHVYSRIFYWLYWILKPIVNRQSGKAIYDQYTDKQYDYEIDGVKVSRLPIYKWRPGGRVNANNIIKQVDWINGILRKEGFSPDFMVGHVFHPNIEILSELKRFYPVPTSITLHGIHNTKVSKECLDRMDCIGFRSFAIKNAFEQEYGNIYNGFMCFSGIPISYIRKDERKWNQGIQNFLYVGSLIRRKHPESLIPAVCDAFQNENYKITYVGEGGEHKRIESLANRYGITGRVALKGQLKRDDILKGYDDADLFVMISENEAFGLVYLEAMARGCIVVASRNEGMDGIIKDGENGFLCEAGNSSELTNIIRRVGSLSEKDLERISAAAIYTATQMTDRIAAENYLNVLKGNGGSR